MKLPTSHDNLDVSPEEGDRLQGLVNSVSDGEAKIPQTPEPANKRIKTNPTSVGMQGADDSTPTDVLDPLTPRTPGTPLVVTPKRNIDFKTEDANAVVLRLDF